MAEEHVQRRLAAILAADVVGYSRLMALDEAGTVMALKARRKGILQPLVAKHQGRIVKLMGDGALVEFASAVNAVACAVELQRAMAAANTDLPEDRKLVLRIGINLGDVIVEGSDLYGDGVNIAARLETLAEPGSVYLSQAVYSHIRGKVPQGFDDLGEQSLKNMAEPVRVYRVSGTAAQAASAAPSMAAQPPNPSIAVLPFANMSGDPQQEYFSDGITEDIISGLARLHWLFVIARNSSFTYKGRAVDARQIGRELGVRYLLEGSVRKAGERLRITSQLIDAASGAHIWSDRFEGTLTDIFDLQDQVTASVVGAIEPKLRHAEIERARMKRTESVDAYDLFLRAVALIQTRRPAETKEAVGLLYRAIEIDRRYAAAHALAAYGIFRQKVEGWVSPSDPALLEGIRLARLAAEMGRDDPETMWMAGLAISLLAGDLGDGLALIERSLELNPNSANAWMASGLVRAYLGDSETAAAHLERSGRLSPLDPLAFATRAGFVFTHFIAGRYEEALTWCDKVLHEAPEFPPALRIKVAACGLLGRPEEGRRWVKRLLAVNPDASVSTLRAYYQPVMKKAGSLESLLDGARKAGLPE